MRFLLIGLAACLLAAGGAHGEIRVRIQDYAEVPAATLDKAKTFASAIFARAGVNVHWANCSPHSKTHDSVCDIPLGPMDLQVRVLNQTMAKRTQASRHSVGYAMLAGRYPSIASVFHHRTEELEGRDLALRGKILGAALAHEIGHLLLNENHHSESGILRARWSDQDLKLIVRGRMWFNADEVERMISLAEERRRAGGAETTIAAKVSPGEVMTSSGERHELP